MIYFTLELRWREKCCTCLPVKASPYIPLVTILVPYLTFGAEMPVQDAVLPLLAAKQRETHPNDWMPTDADVECPDPHCKSLLRTTRTGKRTFSRGAVTVVPLITALETSGEWHVPLSTFEHAS